MSSESKYEQLAERVWKVTDKLLEAEAESNVDIVTGLQEAAQEIIAVLPPRKPANKKVKWNIAFEMLQNGDAKRGRPLHRVSQYSGGELVAEGEHPGDWVVYNEGYFHLERGKRSGQIRHLHFDASMMNNWEIELSWH